MRITVSSPSTGIGYFPGLAAPKSLDLAVSPSDTAAELRAAAERLVKAGAGAEGARSGATSSDAVIAQVTIEADDGSVHRIEGVSQGELRAFVTAFHRALRSQAGQ